MSNPRHPHIKFPTRVGASSTTALVNFGMSCLVADGLYERDILKQLRLATCEAERIRLREILEGLREEMGDLERAITAALATARAAHEAEEERAQVRPEEGATGSIENPLRSLLRGYLEEHASTHTGGECQCRLCQQARETMQAL